jgi:hypothetical protein
MSTSTNVYAVYGVKIESYDEDFANKYDTTYPDNGIGAIFDGIDGEYMVLGKILYSGGETRYDEEGDPFTTINPVVLELFEAQYKAEFAKVFPDYIHLIDKPFQLQFFKYWH